MHSDYGVHGSFKELKEDENSRAKGTWWEETRSKKQGEARSQNLEGLMGHFKDTYSS